jgi:hypothetical protein
MRIDRYGSDFGSFVSPEGTPFPARSLHPEAAGRPYSVFEVVKPIDVDAGVAAPYYGQPGLGVQYELPASVKELIKRGVLRRVRR